MPTERLQPGAVRDVILAYLRKHGDGTVEEIAKAADAKLGRPIPRSSVRSYLNLNVPDVFKRLERGRYKLTNP
jgi:hypothetical protein